MIDGARYQVTAKLRQGRTVGRTLYLQRGDEPSDEDQLVGMVDDPELAAFLCEVHNTYVGAFSLLVGLPHSDAIPEQWRDKTREPLSLMEVVKLLCEHIPANSVGAP